VDSSWSSDTTVAVPFSADAHASAIVYRLSSVANPNVSPPQGESTFNDSTDTAADPPNLTPTGGSKTYKWLAAYYHRDSSSPIFASVYPYTQESGVNPRVSSAGAASNTLIESCSDDITAASENPSSYTTSTSSPWTAITIAIHPATTTVTGIDLVDLNDDNVGTLTDLKWDWFDQADPKDFVAPIAQGTAEVTTNGVLDLEFDGSILTSGQTGFLVLKNEDNNFIGGYRLQVD
jgi:hypothetical protein